MKPLVSIVVPIYNTSLYIGACIDSILEQSYGEWELLLIDDGSTDDSYKICQSFCDQDSRIRLISKVNSGVSATRNLGIGLANGKYIMFLDSDDYWCDTNILMNLVDSAERLNLDVVRGEYVEVDANGTRLKVSNSVSYRRNFVGEILGSYQFYKDVVKTEFFSVLCLYRREVLDGILFNTQRVFLEDAEFYLDLCLKQLRCAYLPCFFYAYRKHSESVSVKPVPNKFQDALNFTLLCLKKARESTCASLGLIYVLDGIHNYIYDLQVIGESNSRYSEIQKLYDSHNIRNIRLKVIEEIRTRNLYSYFFVLLPLNCIVFYYRWLLHFKVFVINILRKLNLYE